MKPMTPAQLKEHRHRAFERPAKGTLVDASDMTEAELHDFNHPDEPGMTQEQSIAFNAADQLARWCWQMKASDNELDPGMSRAEAHEHYEGCLEIVQGFVLKHP